MANVSHNGATYTIAASRTTLGIPVPITAFPKDTNPFEIADTQFAEVEIGTNGHEISYEMLEPIVTTCAIIPGTANAETMFAIASANRAESGKRSVRDVITVVRVNPNGSTVTLTGRMTKAPLAETFEGSGKVKTPVFEFKFHKVFRTPVVVDLDVSL